MHDRAKHVVSERRDETGQTRTRPDFQASSGPAKLYRHVIDTLQHEIALGMFAAGARLPSERVLVDRFAVSRLTIREALVGMEILGLIEARQGSGYFATGAIVPPRGGADALDIGAFELTEARRIVEVQAAALAALAATGDQMTMNRRDALSAIGLSGGLAGVAGMLPATAAAQGRVSGPFTPDWP